MNLYGIKKVFLLVLLSSGCAFSTQEVSFEEQLQKSVAKIDPKETSVVFVDLQNVFVGRLSAGCTTNGLFSSEKHDSFVPAVQKFAARLKSINANLFQTLDYHPDTHISFQNVYREILQEFAKINTETALAPLYFAVVGRDGSRWVVKLSSEALEQLSQNNICVMVEVAALSLELESKIPQKPFRILPGFDSSYFQHIPNDVIDSFVVEHELEFRIQPTFQAHSLAFASPKNPASATSIFSSDIISDDCSVCKGCYSHHDSFSGFDSFAKIFNGQALPLRFHLEKELKDTLLAKIIQPKAEENIFRDEVYVGCATDICVFATVKEAVKIREQRKADYRIIVVKKYCSAFDEEAAEKCLKELADLGVEIVDDLEFN